uniref:Large ribosomal subunit protein P2 n=1 Tax=Cerebratulus lacteus TaxID=6221 RepID=A0A0U2U9S6_CERLA|nr:acidic ribosomal protein P2 [Cerebratulus lacteus]
MRYVAAYLLAVLGGKANPSKTDIEKILSSVGIEAEADKINKIVSELKGKAIEEVLAEGRTKLASVPSGGGAAASTGAAAAGGEAAVEAKEEAKKEESEEESDDDMGFGLFD